MMKLQYESASGVAIFEDPENPDYPFVVVQLEPEDFATRRNRLHGDDTSTQEVYEASEVLGEFVSMWRARVESLVQQGYTQDKALAEVERRDLRHKQFKHFEETEHERLGALRRTLTALAPVHTRVGIDHLGGGLYAVGVNSTVNDAYLWVTDHDGYPLMGFYKDHEDEEGIMVEPLGKQHATLDSPGAIKAVADALNRLGTFFKGPSLLEQAGARIRERQAK